METVTMAATPSSVTTEVIRVRGLTFTYPKSTQPAVRGMDFSVAAARSSASSVPAARASPPRRKLLIGLLRGHGGEATVWGKDPLRWGPDYYQRIGVSFELPNHYQKLTGLENLRFFASLYDGDTLDPMDLLDAVGLADDADTRVGKYSKGMQMRLTFVRALINDPELLFLDEPTSGLDPVNARKVKNIILDLKDRGPHGLSHHARHGDRRRTLRQGGLRRRRPDRRTRHARRAEDREKPTAGARRVSRRQRPPRHSRLRDGWAGR